MKTTSRLLATVATLGIAAILTPALSHADTQNADLKLSLTVYQNIVNGEPATLGHQSNAASFSAGKLDDPSYHRFERGILVFSLPEIPQGEQLVSATLKLYVRGSATNGAASVYHSPTQNRQTGSNDFYNDPSYTDFAGDIATPATGGTNASPVLVTLDVTQWIRADYLLEGNSAISSFRIQIDGLDFTKTNQNNRYSFFGSTAADAAYIPVLELEFGPSIPEPATTGIAASIAGLALALAVRRNRSRRAARSNPHAEHTGSAR